MSSSQAPPSIKFSCFKSRTLQSVLRNGAQSVSTLAIAIEDKDILTSKVLCQMEETVGKKWDRFRLLLLRGCELEEVLKVDGMNYLVETLRKGIIHVASESDTV